MRGLSGIVKGVTPLTGVWGSAPAFPRPRPRHALSVLGVTPYFFLKARRKEVALV